MNKEKRQKKIRNNKSKSAFVRYDEELGAMLLQLKEKLGFEKDSQLMRFAVKQLHRRQILNLREIA